MKEDDKEEIRDTFKDLLDEAEDNLPVESPSNSDLPSRMDLPQMDYTDVKDKATKRGQKIMNSLLKLYLSEEIIQNNEYIAMKAKIDQMTLASLIFQMQTAEHALTTLLRTIDSGELHPRMFEVLGGLQKTMLDIMKHQTLHLHAMEEGAKKLKHDIDIYDDKKIESPTTKQSSSDDNVNRGTRNMMRGLHEEMNGEDIDFEEVDNDK